MPQTHLCSGQAEICPDERKAKDLRAMVLSAHLLTACGVGCDDPLHRTRPFFVQHTLFHGEKEYFKAEETEVSFRIFPQHFKRLGGSFRLMRRR